MRRNTHAAQKKPAEIPQKALPKSMNHVVAETLLVYSPAPYSGYPMAWCERYFKCANGSVD